MARRRSAQLKKPRPKKPKPKKKAARAGEAAQRTMTPSAERRRQGLVEEAGTLPDVRGDIGAPYRAVDTLERMARAGTITGELREAGERFRNDFARAALDPLYAPRLDRLPGSRRAGDLPDTVLGARAAVHRALAALGGMATPVAEAAWAILGEGRSIKEWCERRPWGRAGRGLKPETASGILIAALSLLASHYGLIRKGR